MYAFLGFLFVIASAVLFLKFKGIVDEKKKNNVEKPFSEAMKSNNDVKYFAIGIMLFVFAFLFFVVDWAKEAEKNEYRKYSSFASSSYSSSSSSYNSSSSSSFTNKYGSPSTECAHPGCTNKIASSGDTNCCTTHSRRCANCGCYIDEDAIYCMNCLKSAFD